MNLNIKPQWLLEMAEKEDNKNISAGGHWHRTPQPGQTYRHRKHNPDAGKWHKHELPEQPLTAKDFQSEQGENPQSQPTKSRPKQDGQCVNQCA